MLSISHYLKVLKLSSLVFLGFFDLNVLLDPSSILLHSFDNLTCTYIFADSTGENLWLSSLLVIPCLFFFQSCI